VIGREGDNLQLAARASNDLERAATDASGRAKYGDFAGKLGHYVRLAAKDAAPFLATSLPIGNNRGTSATNAELKAPSQLRSHLL
jgi:hypothetical protein